MTSFLIAVAIVFFVVTVTAAFAVGHRAGRLESKDLHEEECRRLEIDTWNAGTKHGRELETKLRPKQLTEGSYTQQDLVDVKDTWFEKGVEFGRTEAERELKARSQHCEELIEKCESMIAQAQEVVEQKKARLTRAELDAMEAIKRAESWMPDGLTLAEIYHRRFGHEVEEDT
jgi:hypothetical protein